MLHVLGNILPAEQCESAGIDLHRTVEHRQARRSFIGLGAFRRRRDGKCHDPARYILQIPHAALFECCRNSRSDGIHDPARNQDPARIGQGFETCSNHDRFTERQIVLEEHLAEMNADAQTPLAGMGSQSQLMLRFESTANGIHRTFEKREYSVSRHLKKRSAVCLQLLANNRSYFVGSIDRAGFFRRPRAAEIARVSHKNCAQAAMAGLVFLFRTLSHLPVT